MSWEDDLKVWSEDRTGDQPTASEAEALVTRAQEARQGPSRLMLAVGRSFVAAAVIFGVWTGLSAPEVEESAPAEVAEVADETVATEPPGEEAAESEWMDEGTQQVWSWQVAVAADSLVRDEQRALVVEAGSVELWTMPRWEGEAITVRAGEWSVTGLGGRFAVKQSPFAVEVIEGTVELVGAQVWTLVAGDRFEGGRVLSKAAELPVMAPAVEEQLTALRKQVVAGELEAARDGLAALSEAGDVSATRLLGKVEERLGNVDAAVAAYRLVIAQTGGQQERYLAASLLLEARPGEAEGLLRDFLAVPDPLAAEARLMLGRALVAQGREVEARVELERVVEEHPGTTPARVAREVAEGL